MARDLAIARVDAFTAVAFQGNPAGVVTRGGEDLSDAQMLSIAREMNVSETAFLLPASKPGADLRIRWFTPAVEVSLCGHATIASFHVAAEEGSWGLAGEGTRRLRVETRAGILPVEVDLRPGAPALVRMGLPDPHVTEWQDTGAVRAALGLATDAVAREAPPIQCGEYVLLPVGHLRALKDLKPDVTALRRIPLPGGADGVIVVTTHTTEPLSAVHLRMFAPAAGLAEDPGTGSAQGPVAAWLARAGYFSGAAGSRAGTAGGGDDEPTRPIRKFHRAAGGRIGYTAEQGDFLGRRCRIEVELDANLGAAPPSVKNISIHGTAVTVLTGRIRIP